MSATSPNMGLWPDPEEANFLLSLSPNELLALDQFYNARNGHDPFGVHVAEVQSGAVPSPEVLQVDKSHLHAIHKFLLDMNYTDEVDLSSPVLRKVFRPGYTLSTVLILYFVLSLFGVLGNLVMVSSILKKKRYKCNTLACILNISLGFWFQLIVVIPLSVFVLLVHNWVLGKFVCYLLPMVQDIPHYSLMLTILLLSVDRYKSICGDEQSRIPIVWALVTAWGVAIVLVLPYSAYITYIDLSVLGESLLGGQMCFVSLTGSASQYIKALFILIYLIPSGVSLMLLILTWNELRHQERSLQTLGIQEERRGSREPQAHRAPRSSLVPLNEDEGGGASALDHRCSKRRSSRAMPSSRGSVGTSEVLLSSSSIQPGSSNTIILTEAALGLDIRKESRAQKYLLLIALVYVICLFPLNVLRIVRQIVDEKYENDGHFDYSYIIIVWVAFLPTILVPWIFTHWILIGALTTNHFGRLIRQTSHRQRSAQEVAHQRRNEEAARFPEQISWPHGPVNGKSPTRRCSGLTQCAKGNERQGASNIPGPSEREMSTTGRGGHRAEHYRYNGAHSSVEPSTSQMTFEAITLNAPPQHPQQHHPQQHAQQHLTNTSHHRQSYHDQMIRKTLPDKRASLCGGGGTLGQAMAPSGNGRCHESMEQDDLRLESIQCFNQHQGRRKSIPSREEVQSVNRLRTGLCASNDQLNDSRRQSYCPGYHVRSSNTKNGREQHRSHAHNRDDLRRHSCLPHTETDRHRNLTSTKSQPSTKITEKQLRVSLY